MLRYIHSLQVKDLSLIHSMIPLGSCTMKLNATAEMIPVTWNEFSQVHPFAPLEQTSGYHAHFFRSWNRGWPKSPDLPASPYSLTQDPKENTPGSW